MTRVKVVADGWPIASKLHTIVAGGDSSAMVESVGLALTKIPDVLSRVEPDIVVVHGDRFDAMAVAVAASFMNICVAHLEGGEVTGTIDESIRHAISKLSHLHFVSTEEARQRLVSMGEKTESVVHAGCPAMDIICNLDLAGAGETCRSYKVEPGGFLILSHHPVTSDVESSLKEFDVLTDALLHLGIPAILLYPNVDAGTRSRPLRS